MATLPPVSLAEVITAFSVLNPETPEARILLAKSFGFDYLPEPKEEEAPELVQK